VAPQHRQSLRSRIVDAIVEVEMEQKHKVCEPLSVMPYTCYYTDAVSNLKRQLSTCSSNMHCNQINVRAFIRAHMLACIRTNAFAYTHIHADNSTKRLRRAIMRHVSRGRTRECVGTPQNSEGHWMSYNMTEIA
jgi:hypothetical protein